MKILLTFTGFHDPFSRSVVEKRKQAGPILSMLEARQFDALILFNTPGTIKQTAATLEAVEKAFPEVSCEVKKLTNLADPTDHVSILRYLRRFKQEILDTHQGAEFFVSIASGTPSMHACWLLTVADGTIPARILYGHPSRDAVEPYRVTEIDLSAEEFPEIVPRQLHHQDHEKEYVSELPTICKELQIVGAEQAFVNALDRAARLAKYDCHVLLLGETGTGKEHFARLIHRVSGRPADRFVVVNCASLPKELAESILFGHERGAFTGASHKQPGEFSRAHRGVLFLDEIGEMSSGIQAKLLRVLQDGKIRPLGGTDIDVDVRVIAATNMDVGRAIREQRFRSDLAQRFIDTIELPPLRSRRGDIVKLATFALMRWNRRHGEHRSLARNALQKMQAYPWPGNVRELISAVERAAMLARRQSIRAEDLHLGEAAWLSGCQDMILPEPQVGFSLSDYLSEMRKGLINKAIAASGGNSAQAARILGVTPQAVHKFLKKSGGEDNLG